MPESKSRITYCYPHSEWKVKDGNGTFVCVSCRIEERLEDVI